MKAEENVRKNDESRENGAREVVRTTTLIFVTLLL